ncbi:hypothetical protein ASD39_08185 [Sphingomonas sp. Root50]|nr:hypothetical protein ASD17_04945 [Sphingomonas sp. Root1294]KQY67875.1 hypothetical protein ASD39_08185 [Sphingomonas sp. Root50]KRB88799.1 hypothetical protein ASE22_20530 [Sphingomonas sp. Root720]
MVPEGNQIHTAGESPRTDGGMILYHSPGSCSTAAMLALEESGLPYALETISVQAGDTRTAEFIRRDPWGGVPALVLPDGSCLTETVAILQFLADAVPDRELLPPNGTVARARAVSFLARLTGTVHIAFRPLLRPDKLASTREGQQDVRHTGIAALNGVLERLEDEIRGEDSVLVSGFSLCDVYALVFAHWTLRPLIREHVIATPRLHAVGRAVQRRPATSGRLPAQPRL